MGLQARGRVRRHKEGLKKPKPEKSAPSTDDIEDQINLHKQRIIDYLTKELDVLLASPGCRREVIQIARALEQLRPKRSRDPEGDDDPLPADARDLFGPPPS